jgi:hypothetical protein
MSEQPTPLSPREFFGPPWSGTGEWTPRAAISLVAPGRRFAFRTFTTFITDDLWLIHDETAWEDGRIERRDGVARLVAPDRFRLTYDGMPGGAEIHLREDGFEATPYSLTVALHPFPFSVTVQCADVCTLRPTGELLDVIDVSLVGVPLGRSTITLRPETA